MGYVLSPLSSHKTLSGFRRETTGKGQGRIRNWDCFNAYWRRGTSRRRRCWQQCGGRGRFRDSQTRRHERCPSSSAKVPLDGGDEINRMATGHAEQRVLSAGEREKVGRVWFGFGSLAYIDGYLSELEGSNAQVSEQGSRKVLYQKVSV